MLAASYISDNPIFLYGSRVPESDVNLAYAFVESPEFDTATEIQDIAIPALSDMTRRNQKPPLIFRAADDNSGVLVNVTTNSSLLSTRHVRLTRLFAANQCDAEHALIFGGKLAYYCVEAEDSIPSNVSHCYVDPNSVSLVVTYIDGTVVSPSLYLVQLQRVVGAPAWVYEVRIYTCWTPRAELGLVVSYSVAVRSSCGEWMVASVRRSEHLAQDSAIAVNSGNIVLSPTPDNRGYSIVAHGARTIDLSPGCLFRWHIRATVTNTEGVTVATHRSFDMTSYVAQQDGVKILANGLSIKRLYAIESPGYVSATDEIGTVVTYTPAISLPPIDVPPYMNAGGSVTLTVDDNDQVCASTSIARMEPEPGDGVLDISPGCWVKVSLLGSDVTEEQFAWQANVKEKTMRVNAPRRAIAINEVKGVGDGCFTVERIEPAYHDYKQDDYKIQGGPSDRYVLVDYATCRSSEWRNSCSAKWYVFVPRQIAFNWTAYATTKQDDAFMYDPVLTVNAVNCDPIMVADSPISLPNHPSRLCRLHTYQLVLKPGWNTIGIRLRTDHIHGEPIYLSVERMYLALQSSGVFYYAIDLNPRRYPPQITERTVAVRHSENVRYGQPITIDAKNHAPGLDTDADLQWLLPVSCDNSNVVIECASDYANTGVFMASVKQSSGGQVSGSIILRKDSIAEGERAILASWQQLASLFNISNKTDDELLTLVCCLDDHSWNIMARIEHEATEERLGGLGTKMSCWSLKTLGASIVARGAIGLKQTGSIFAVQELTAASSLSQSSNAEWYDPWHVDIPDIAFTREIRLPSTSHPMYDSLWPELRPYAGQIASCYYSVPEYESQAWSPVYPIALVAETPRLYNENTLAVSYPPSVPNGWDSIQLSTDAQIVDVDSVSRHIVLDRDVTRDMPISVRYKAIVRSYRYTGYVQNHGGAASIVSLNLNPGPYQVSNATTDKRVYGHTTTVQYEEMRTSELVGTSFIVYLVPTVVRVDDAAVAMVAVRQTAVYHATYTPAELDELDPLATPLGIVKMKQTARPEDVVVIDTRRRGGGLSESMDSAEVASDVAMSHWDIGRWDGQIYVDGGVVCVELYDYVTDTPSYQKSKDELIAFDAIICAAMLACARVCATLDTAVFAVPVEVVARVHATSDAAVEFIRLAVANVQVSATSTAVSIARCVYAASFDGTVHKVKLSGALVWARQISNDIAWCITVHPTGCIYAGTVDGDVLQLSSDGTTAWSRNVHTNDVHGIAVDSSGNAYSAGWDGALHKLSSSGTSIWTYQSAASPLGNSVAVDADGNIYCGIGPLYKLSSGGVCIWTYNGHICCINSVAVDPSGYTYSVSWDEDMHKVSPSGDCVGSYAGDPEGAWSVAVDPAGYIYLATGDDPGVVRKFSSTGSVVWSYTGHSGEVRSVATGHDGYVYSGSHDGTMRKITSSGTMVWSYNGSPDFGVEGVAVDPGCYGAFSGY